MSPDAPQAATFRTSLPPTAAASIVSVLRPCASLSPARKRGRRLGCSVDKRIVVLTGSELRHTFLRKALAVAPGVEVLRSYCEGVESTVVDMVAAPDVSGDQKAHIAALARSEDEIGRAPVRTPVTQAP